MTGVIGRLHVITDASIQRRFGHDEIARLAIAGGADTIQFRDKSLGSRGLLERARAILRVCRESEVPLIINDRPDIAMAVDADGVHLGQNDLPIPTARRLLGPSKRIGGTASTVEEALEVERAGADYVGFGHIYATSSKVKHGPSKGVDALRSVCDVVKIPVIAIGGIDADNIGPVLDTGVWGVAVIAAVCTAQDPRGATRQLRDALERP